MVPHGQLVNRGPDVGTAFVQGSAFFQEFEFQFLAQLRVLGDQPQQQFVFLSGGHSQDGFFQIGGEFGHGPLLLREKFVNLFSMKHSFKGQHVIFV